LVNERAREKGKEDLFQMQIMQIMQIIQVEELIYLKKRNLKKNN
tara:strand:- start:344 stop:475 length:132 start_codon:yes stop_codon:yes gene_type:complete